MAEIVITPIASGEQTGTPIVVEVIGPDSGGKGKQVIRLGSSGRVTVPDLGTYTIQASLPSGRTAIAACTIESDAQVVEVSVTLARGIPHESLEWTSATAFKLSSEAKDDSPDLGGIWLRLWGCGSNGRWTVRPWPAQMAKRDAGVTEYEFPLRDMEGSQYFLQVGGSGMQWRLTAMPGDDVRVLIAAAAPESRVDETDSAVDIAVVSLNPSAEVLASYLVRGDIVRARPVGHALLAEELIEGKPRDATYAAVAGYFLLATNDLERLNELWSKKLVDNSTWLPDMPVSMRGARYGRRARTWPAPGAASSRPPHAACRSTPEACAFCSMGWPSSPTTMNAPAPT